jgi:hypothetical protein
MEINFDKIINEIQNSWRYLKPNNLVQFRQLNYSANQSLYRFSWTNKKYIQKLTENCKKITFNLDEYATSFLNNRGIECNDFILRHFVEKFWEQILNKYSQKIVAIHNYCFVATEDLEITVEPFKIIKADPIQYIYPVSEGKWVLIIEGQRIYKGMSKKLIDDVEKDLIDHFRIINLKKILTD